MRTFITFAAVTAVFAAGFSAAASDLVDACVAGAPDGASAEDAAAYCSCLDAATSGDDAVRDELIASWPAGTVEDWIASLSDDAAAAAGSCAG